MCTGRALRGGQQRRGSPRAGAVQEKPAGLDSAPTIEKYVSASKDALPPFWRRGGMYYR